MPVERADLRLVVDNLGPIEHASVALKPLTVLIGRNNTGKTYLAQALYAARRAIHDSRRSLPEPLTTLERRDLVELLLKRASSESHLLRRPLQDVQLQIAELPQDAHAKVTTWVRQVLSDVGQSLEGQLCASFAVPSADELRRWDQPNSLLVELRGVQYEGKSVRLFGTSGSSVSDLGLDVDLDVTVTLDPFDYDPDSLTERLMHPSDDRGERADWLNQQVSRALMSATWRGYLSSVGLRGRAHYLPAGRSGLLHAWTDVVRLKLELDREQYGLSRLREPALDGVALDFISSLAGLLTHRLRPGKHGGAWWPRTRRDPIGPDSLSLLRQVMNGEIYSGAGDDMVPTLGYEQGGHRIAIRRASSMVADLAPLAMWIDRIVEPGDLLIIDEPESHLHPETIRLVARVLVRLVGEGVSVVCATHSAVLIHELSNCLLLGQQQNPATRDDKGGYEVSDRLSLDDIAVHRFHRPDPDGPVEVTQVDIEPDWGIPEDEYVDVATEQSDDTSRLIDSLT